MFSMKCLQAAAAPHSYCYNNARPNAREQPDAPGTDIDSAMPTQSTSLSDNSLSPRMLAAAGKFITEKKLISGGDRVLCMVSGGPDSVLMLRILARLACPEESAFKGTFSLGVCHVNYRRRGEASDEDESFVRWLGDRAGIQVHAVRAPEHAGANFQAWARDFRYLAAQNLCRWQGYNRIAVGHNKDDRIETFLYRLITYSGRRSLVVMPPRRGRVIRPLLFLESARIRAYCRHSGILFREDKSNLSMEYARNRIREQVIPLLEELRPDFRGRILETLAQLEDEQEVLGLATDAAWEHVSIKEDGQTMLSAGGLAGLPPATARLLLRRWLAQAAGGVRLSRRILDSVLGLCQNLNGSRELSLSGGFRVERRYAKLCLTAAGAAPAPEPVRLPVPGGVMFGDYEIEVVKSPWWGAAATDPWLASIDAGALPAPLSVRSWRRGDRLVPLGQSGSKSLQDLFVDAKIPRSLRSRVPVVVSGEKIVWVAGLRIAQEFRVTPGSEQLLGLKATRRIVDNPF